MNFQTGDTNAEKTDAAAAEKVKEGESEINGENIEDDMEMEERYSNNFVSLYCEIGKTDLTSQLFSILQIQVHLQQGEKIYQCLMEVRRTA